MGTTPYTYASRIGTPIPTASVASSGDRRTDKITPPATTRFRLCFVIDEHLVNNFLPTQTGTPMIMAGTEMAAISVMPIGAPINVPSCHNSFFLRLHGFLPQKVQPDGLR
jgi:hypothetical protein